ncbi:putative amino acid permease 7 [Apium graveolens]|uniref:putative amino acid permease 7 n=1 Tax=Apium graveolens TaxID=4045 RepID=UPI003D7A2941
MDTDQSPDDGLTPLLHNSTGLSPPSNASLHTTLVNRNGNIWTAVAHIITGVIGSGVLSLAWSMSQLGWIAGPLSIISFALMSLLSAFLLCECYRSPHPDFGPSRNGSYMDAVKAILGNWSVWLCDIFFRLNLFKTGVVYIITSGISMRAIQQSNCYHKDGHKASCEYEDTSYMLIFGIVQIFVSQIPDFSDTKWLSIVAAIMSFTYAGIGSALGLAKVLGDGQIKGSIQGAPAATRAQKVWSSCQALGDVAFGFNYALILLNIQDTLRSPPEEKATMKKASVISTSITTFFYLCCGGFGYAAFGNSTPGNLLTGFGFYEPYWLLDFANACIVLHLVGGYQVYSQPQFALAERSFVEKFPDSVLVCKNFPVKLPWLPSFRLNLLRLCFRTAYVALTITIGMIFPYFNQVVAVAGAFTYWPLVIHFPLEMYLVQKNIRPYTGKWVALRVYSAIALLVAMFALVGSIEGLVSAKFGSNYDSRAPRI